MVIPVNLVAPVNLVWSPKPVWSFCIICHMNKFQLSLAHLWTDFQSSYIWGNFDTFAKGLEDGVWMKLLPVFQWHQWTAEQCQGKLNSTRDKSFQAPVGQDPAWQNLTIFAYLQSSSKGCLAKPYHRLKCKVLIGTKYQLSRTFSPQTCFWFQVQRGRQWLLFLPPPSP